MEDNTTIDVLENVQMVRLFRHSNNYNHQDDFFNRITQHCKTIRLSLTRILTGAKELCFFLKVVNEKQKIQN